MKKMVEISVSDLEELTSSVLELDRHLGLMREVGFMVLAGKTYDDMDKEWSEDFEKNNDVDLSTEEGLSGYICFHDYFRNTTLIESSKTIWGMKDLLGIRHSDEIENKRFVEDMIATDTDIPIATDEVIPF